MFIIKYFLELIHFLYSIRLLDSCKIIKRIIKSAEVVFSYFKSDSPVMFVFFFFLISVHAKERRFSLLNIRHFSLAHPSEMLLLYVPPTITENLIVK